MTERAEMSFYVELEELRKTGVRQATCWLEAQESRYDGNFDALNDDFDVDELMSNLIVAMESPFIVNSQEIADMGDDFGRVGIVRADGTLSVGLEKSYAPEYQLEKAAYDIRGQMADMKAMIVDKAKITMDIPNFTLETTHTRRIPTTYQGDPLTKIVASMIVVSPPPMIRKELSYDSVEPLTFDDFQATYIPKKPKGLKRDKHKDLGIVATFPVFELKTTVVLFDAKPHIMHKLMRKGVNFVNFVWTPYTRSSMLLITRLDETSAVISGDRRSTGDVREFEYYRSLPPGIYRHHRDAWRSLLGIRLADISPFWYQYEIQTNQPLGELSSISFLFHDQTVRQTREYMDVIEADYYGVSQTVFYHRRSGRMQLLAVDVDKQGISREQGSNRVILPGATTHPIYRQSSELYEYVEDGVVIPGVMRLYFTEVRYMSEYHCSTGSMVTTLPRMELLETVYAMQMKGSPNYQGARDIMLEDMYVYQPPTLEEQVANMGSYIGVVEPSQHDNKNLEFSSMDHHDYPIDFGDQLSLAYHAMLEQESMEAQHKLNQNDKKDGKQKGPVARSKKEKT